MKLLSCLFSCLLVFGIYPTEAQSVKLNTRTDWFVFSNPAETEARIIAPNDAAGTLEFHAVGTPVSFFSGIYRNISCQAGKELNFSALVKGLEPLRESRGQISIEWKDANGQEFSRSNGPTWGEELSLKDPMRFTMQAVAPENAVSASFVITMLEDGKASGAFRVLEISLD